MKWLRKHHRGRPERVDEAPQCEHVTLIPRWERAEEIGQADKVATYRCEACGTEFTFEEAARLRETEAARVRRRIAS